MRPCSMTNGQTSLSNVSPSQKSLSWHLICSVEITVCLRSPFLLLNPGSARCYLPTAEVTSQKACQDLPWYYLELIATDQQIRPCTPRQQASLSVQISAINASCGEKLGRSDSRFSNQWYMLWQVMHLPRVETGLDCESRWFGRSLLSKWPEGYGTWELDRRFCQMQCDRLALRPKAQHGLSNALPFSTQRTIIRIHLLPFNA